jgi:DNA-binding NtrC family response regulator
MDEPIAVLVVDDDASIQNVLEETLTEGGFASKAASSGEEAIALLNAGRYRVLIIDASPTCGSRKTDRLILTKAGT